MAENFQAFVVDKNKNGGHVGEFRSISKDQLMDGDVEVLIHYSTVNYKDGLNVTGKAKIARISPLIAGIDFAGIVTQSDSSEFQKGDMVLLNGYGVGEKHHGGYAKYARVSSKWLIKMPPNLNMETAMAIGTAGYTAMLAIMKLQKNNIKPGDGPIIVSGAKGGLGSIAVHLLAENGYEIVALTRDPANEDYLKHLGAHEIMSAIDFSKKAPILSKARYAGAIDTVGGNILANILSQTKYNGCVTACGLAMTDQLNTNVGPFIFRGVTLAGIDSVMTPRKIRINAWKRIADEIKEEKIASITFLSSFDEIPALAQKIVNGKIRGRAVVSIK